MRITLSGSCRPIEVVVFLSPICCGSFCHRRSVYLDVVARESCRVASGTVSPYYFFPSFLESRGPGTVLLTVPWLSQWIAGPLHNASGNTGPFVHCRHVRVLCLPSMVPAFSSFFFSLSLSFSFSRERDGG